MQSGVASIVPRYCQLHTLDCPFHWVEHVARQGVGRGVDNPAADQQPSGKYNADGDRRREFPPRAKDGLQSSVYDTREVWYRDGPLDPARPGGDQVAHADGGHTAQLWRGLQRACGLQADSQAQQGFQFLAQVWVLREALCHGFPLLLDGGDIIIQDVLKTSGWIMHSSPSPNPTLLMRHSAVGSARPVSDIE